MNTLRTQREEIAVKILTRSAGIAAILAAISLTLSACVTGLEMRCYQLPDGSMHCEGGGTSQPPRFQ
jgi:hypothetical protein